MKIAFVQDWLTGFAGGEQVLLALHHLYPEAPIYTSLYLPEKVPQFAQATVIPSYLQKIPGLAKRHQLAIPLMPLAFESFNLKEYDIVVSVGGGLSKGVITYPGQRHITYCNTPMRYLWHLGDDNRAEGWLRSRVAHSLRLWDVASSLRPDTYIANSQTVVDRIQKIYRLSAKVVYPPVNTDKFQLIPGPSEDYYLSVCRLVSYKKVDLVIKACIQAKKPLKVVGTGPEEAFLKNLAKNAPWIEFLGRVPDLQLKQLYGRTKGFIFAAEEDFGIVPVEAMSAGKPVLAYGRGGLTESVIRDKTGLFFAEQKPESIAQSFAEFEKREWDPEAIRKNAQRFDQKVFKETMKGIIVGI